jgi:hypothetical protein
MACADDRWPVGTLYLSRSAGSTWHKNLVAIKTGMVLEHLVLKQQPMKSHKLMYIIIESRQYILAATHLVNKNTYHVSRLAKNSILFTLIVEIEVGRGL